MTVTDHKGRLVEVRSIQYPDDLYVPNRFEGVVYIPPDAPMWADHLIAVSYCQAGMAVACIGTEGEIRFLVIQRDGTVVKEIIGNFSDEFWDTVGGVLGIGYQGPNTLLMSSGPFIWKMDFDGNIISEIKTSGNDVDSMEGVAALPSGKVVATGGGAKLKFFDASLNRLPALDRDHTIGLGIAAPIGIAWNTDTQELLIQEQYNGQAVWAVPSSMDAKRKAVDISLVHLGDFATPPEQEALPSLYARVMTYLPDQHQIALGYVNAAYWLGVPGQSQRIQSRLRVVRFNNAGEVVGYDRMFDWDDPVIDVWTWLFSYIPAADNAGVSQYVFRQYYGTQMLYMIGADDGLLDNSMNLSGVGPGALRVAEYFKPANASSGRFLLVGNDLRMALIDAAGTKLWGSDAFRTMRMAAIRDLAYIDSGPYAGAFAGITSENCELIIFRID
jgi:hypothetical protein